MLVACHSGKPWWGKEHDISRVTSSHHPFQPQRSLSAGKETGWMRISSQLCNIFQTICMPPRWLCKNYGNLWIWTKSQDPIKKTLKTHKAAMINPMKVQWSHIPIDPSRSHPPDWPTWRPAALFGDSAARAAPKRRPGSSSSSKTPEIGNDTLIRFNDWMNYLIMIA